MRRILGWLGWGVLGLLGLCLIVAAGGYWWLLQSLPRIDGETVVAGLDRPVTVIRDAHGIPHIEAETFEDALFAQGFVHAQDRLWQMEFQRRVGAGRLAEIVGASALPVDRFMRLLGLYRLAEESLAHLSEETLAWLEAYAAGVNAYLEQRQGPLPPEFLILGHSDLEPWTPADSAVWIKILAMDLSRNWQDELLRARLSQRLSDEQIADLWPSYPEDAPVTLENFQIKFTRHQHAPPPNNPKDTDHIGWGAHCEWLGGGAGGSTCPGNALADLTGDMDLEALAAALPPAPLPGVGSNAWVVSGERSETGAPLLANDPHLGLRAPGTWYLAHLKAPTLELIGAGLPGVPGIVFGHNGQIAWGMTNTGPDTQDLFIEKIDPENADHYLAPNGSMPFSVRDEVIRVKDAEPVTLKIRSTRHGPVISDLIESAKGTLKDDQVLALAWMALAEGDTTFQSLLDLTKARDWPSFLEATKRNHSPQLNVFYADQDGHIGFVAPGRIPVRKEGDGLWPVPGWSGDYDWVDVIPVDELPQTIDPPSGMLLNGNNQIVPDDYPHLITAIWEPPYRARRIDSLLRDQRHDLKSFASMQQDQLSLIADDLLPLMLEITPGSDAASKALEELSAWDRIMAGDKAEPLIFAAWYRVFSRLVYADELGPLFPAFWGVRPQFMTHVLTKKPIWCDDQGTADVETCSDLLSKALDLALNDLKRRYGSDRSDWQWGEAHRARMKHPIFDGQPILETIFNIEQPIGGDSVTINVGHYALGNEQDPFASVQAATYRGLYDLRNLDRSRFIAATGQSGHPLSTHFRDLSSLWAKGETIVMERRPEVYSRSAEGRLILKP